MPRRVSKRYKAGERSWADGRKKARVDLWREVANLGAEIRGRAVKHAGRQPGGKKPKKKPGKKTPALKEYGDIPNEGKWVELGGGRRLAKMNLRANIATDISVRRYVFNREPVSVDLVVEFSAQMLGSFESGGTPKFHAQTADGKRLVIPIDVASKKQLAARIVDLLKGRDYRRMGLGKFNVIVETPEAIIKARELRRMKPVASRGI